LRFCGDFIPESVDDLTKVTDYELVEEREKPEKVESYNFISLGRYF